MFSCAVFLSPSSSSEGILLLIFIEDEEAVNATGASRAQSQLTFYRVSPTRVAKSSWSMGMMDSWHAFSRIVVKQFIQSINIVPIRGMLCSDMKVISLFSS